jgi:hypothetical protein
MLPAGDSRSIDQGIQGAVAGHRPNPDTAAVEPSRRTDLIQRYKEGPSVVAEALADITDDELDARPAPADWTPREVVHHLADSEMTSAIRLRRMLAEDEPIILGYDEAEFARRLFYGERPIQAALDTFRASRETTAEILERLTDDQRARLATHTESGPYGVETWLEIYAAHAHDHADQIRRARIA